MAGARLDPAQPALGRVPPRGVPSAECAPSSGAATSSVRKVLISSRDFMRVVVPTPVAQTACPLTCPPTCPPKRFWRRWKRFWRRRALPAVSPASCRPYQALRAGLWLNPRREFLPPSDGEEGKGQGGPCLCAAPPDNICGNLRHLRMPRLCSRTRSETRLNQATSTSPSRSGRNPACTRPSEK